METVISEELFKLERKHHIKILYAVESGSRGWGFASKDSDYDVRFIYIRPQESYLSIEDQKDYIELPINDLLDINGWDMRKALKLFRKSNASVLEWLSSPIVYRDTHGFAQKLRALNTQYFLPLPSLHHYMNLARNTYTGMLKAESVKIKKYFYVLRPLVACKWIETYNTAAPMAFEELLKGVEIEPAVLNEIQVLMARKALSAEGDIEPVNPCLYQFFNDCIRDLEDKIKEVPKVNAQGKEVLDQVFQQSLKEVWPV